MTGLARSRSVALMARTEIVLLLAAIAVTPLAAGTTGCGGSNIVIGVSPTPTLTVTPTRTPTPSPTP